MKITREPKYERWLLDKIKTWLGAQPRTPGIHLSDLLYPLKAYWKRVDPQPMTDLEALYFLAGQGHHFMLESIVEGSEKVGKADGGSHEWEGISYSPDMKAPHPQEIKTSRARYGPKVESSAEYLREYEHYLKQLSGYQAIDNDAKGDLIVFYLAKEQEGSKRTLPEIRWYRTSLTKAELATRRKELRAVKKLLEKALAAKDPSILPACPSWMCRGCNWAGVCPKVGGEKAGE